MCPRLWVKLRRVKWRKYLQFGFPALSNSGQIALLVAKANANKPITASGHELVSGSIH